jgi:hypothetical protein
MEQRKYTPVHCICIDENIIELLGFYCSAHFTLLFIFFEMEITFEKGTSTVYLPAIERSELNLGPFVEMGSLAICTGTSKFLLTTSEIFPALLMSASNLKLPNKVPGVPLRLIFVSFIRDCT